MNYKRDNQLVTVVRKQEGRTRVEEMILKYIVAFNGIYKNLIYV